MIHHPNYPKYLFSNFEHWEKEFLYKIHWHFFATSHRKGVVGGTGGSVKGSVHRKNLSTGTFKEYTLSANAKASQSSENVNVSSSL